MGAVLVFVIGVQPGVQVTRRSDGGQGERGGGEYFARFFRSRALHDPVQLFGS